MPPNTLPELPYAVLHRCAEFAPAPHVVDQPWIANGESAKFGCRHIRLAQEALDLPVYLHL